MLDKVLGARIAEYAPANVIEQENVLQEILQHYVLTSLSRAGFFDQAIFHGGTSLRIIHGMNHFSEDLDFLLKQPDPDFRWQDFLEFVRKECQYEGISFQARDKSRAGIAVQKAFLKTDSIGQILELTLPFERYHSRKIRIKLEIDTNPPDGSGYSTAYLTFPYTLPLTIQTLESGFALKLHALLCRPYTKGRDWYDFLWYCARRTRIDLLLLKNALLQQGPWAGNAVEVTANWLADRMAAAIEQIDWSAARQDVQRFLPLSEQDGLRAWSKSLFVQQLTSIRGQG